MMIILFLDVEVCCKILKSSRELWLFSSPVTVLLQTRCRSKEVVAAAQMRRVNIDDVILGKVSNCKVGARASLLIIYLGFIAKISIGIAAGAWGLNRSSATNWKAVFCRLVSQTLVVKIVITINPLALICEWFGVEYEPQTFLSTVCTFLFVHRESYYLSWKAIIYLALVQC